MILGFNKSPGADIDVKYPGNIDETLNVKTSDLMNIYALHRMRRMEPNYLQMKIKNVSVASFYTGFSFKHYVGKPDFAITVFLSDNDVLPNDFEGMLRRIAFDLLPRRENEFFTDEFVETFELLQEKDIEPYWEEYLEGEGSKIATIQGEVREEETAPEAAETLEDLNFDDQFEQFEKEELKEEIKELQIMINEKNDKIREFTQKITEGVTGSSDHAEEILIIKDQLDEANAKLDDWSMKLADLAEKNTILMETVRKLTEMSTQQNEEMERQGQKILELKKDIDGNTASTGGSEEIEELNKKISELENEMDEKGEDFESMNKKSEDYIAEIEVLKSEINALNDENDTHLDTIAGLKIELKEATASPTGTDQKTQSETEDQIIELKKDIKVLRRERDHYKNIVKEKDLL